LTARSTWLAVGEVAAAVVVAAAAVVVAAATLQHPHAGAPHSSLFLCLHLSPLTGLDTAGHEVRRGEAVDVTAEGALLPSNPRPPQGLPLVHLGLQRALLGLCRRHHLQLLAQHGSLTATALDLGEVVEEGAVEVMGVEGGGSESFSPPTHRLVHSVHSVHRAYNPKCSYRRCSTSSKAWHVHRQGGRHANSSKAHVRAHPKDKHSTHPPPAWTIMT
jgi:hypothetical protein